MKAIGFEKNISSNKSVKISDDHSGTVYLIYLFLNRDDEMKFIKGN